MRVKNFLIKRNIGLKTFTDMCEYLNLDPLTINSKLSQEKSELFEATINDELFMEWWKLKLALDDAVISNAEKLVSNLKSDTEINEVLGERILNALCLLLQKKFHYAAYQGILIQILDSDKPILNKIDLLKQTAPFVNAREKKSPPSEKGSYLNRESFHDPYEDFHWGGLSGEEAYAAYLNTQ